MSFARYLARRVIAALLLIVVVASAALLLSILAAGVSADDQGQTPETIARRRAEFGLDRPVLVQYFAWLQRVSHLDFGRSILYRRPVIDLVRERALNTAVLATTVLLVATALGIPLGIYTGIRQRGFVVKAVRTLSLLLVSTPPLVTSFGLMMAAALTGWLPVGGMTSPGTSSPPFSAAWISDVASHLVLPTVALALPLAAILERLQSQALASGIREPYVRAALARGLSLDDARVKHAWRGSLGAVLGLYGVMIGALFNGSFIVETVAAWPGLGRLMVDALLARDLFLVAGAAAAGATFLAIGTLCSDLLQAATDPRVLAESRS
jgi:peptide/nickel transport system permease protein